jgi:hypothetical protein
LPPVRSGVFHEECTVALKTSSKKKDIEARGAAFADVIRAWIEHV